MKLPQLDAPEYTVTLKTLGEVTYRPFVVREQKILLMAAESKERDGILLALRKCVLDCTNGKVDIYSIPVFDSILMFMKIRSKSVGEKIELTYRCQNELEDGPCFNEMEFSVDIDDINLTETEGHTNVIQLTKNIGVKMKYPTLADIGKYEDMKKPENQIGLIIDSIESVYTDDSIVTAEEVSREELEEFIDSMGNSQLDMLKNFFETQPKMFYRTELICPKCGTREVITLEDISDFF